MTAVHYHLGKFPPGALHWESLIPLIGPAAAAVARYDGVLGAIPNPALLLSPLTTQEAVLSSRIEGTQATMGEVLEYEAGEPAEGALDERQADIQEVLNYRRAMRHAERMLTNLPLSLRVVREVHAELLSGVRGADKAPGQFRRFANWIGPPGCAVEQARFVPIAPEALEPAMNAWEAYLHADAPDRLVQLAVIHAEFESLHTLLDGNGRLGRILVPLFLWKQGLIRRPMFYLSAYLEANRDAYYEALLAVSRDDNWTDWCTFFLRAVRQQAEDNLDRAQAILQLYERLKPEVAELTHSQYAIHALDWVFGTPMFRSPAFIAGAEVPAPTARRILKALKTHGILKEMRPASGRRAAVLMFPELLNIAEGRDAF